MKQVFFLIATFTFFITAQAQDAPKKWSPEQRRSFISSCVVAQQKHMSSDSSKTYCYCLQEKLEQKFSADQVEPDVLESPEWQAEVTTCLKAMDKWTAKDRSNFLVICNAAEQKVSGKEKAATICNCMLYKTEQKNSDPAKAKTTEATTQTAEWKKMATECTAY